MNIVIENNVYDFINNLQVKGYLKIEISGNYIVYEDSFENMKNVKLLKELHMDYFNLYNNCLNICVIELNSDFSNEKVIKHYEKELKKLELKKQLNELEGE